MVCVILCRFNNQEPELTNLHLVAYSKCRFARSGKFRTAKLPRDFASRARKLEKVVI